MFNPLPVTTCGEWPFLCGDKPDFLNIESSVVFIPCGHKCVCSGCNLNLKKCKYNCPVCRENITEDIID